MHLNEIAKLIGQSTTIGITFHTSPDGDSLGSALALLIALKNKNKMAYIISQEKIPEDFSYLPFGSEISGNLQEPIENTELVIVLDCGNRERINAKLNNYKNTLINIDHHLSNDMYGDFNYVDTRAAAVAEIVYELIAILNMKINKDIATCLYTSLLTDTGSFKYSNTTSRTHNIAAKLIDTSIDFTSIHRNIYENKSFKFLKLQGMVLENMYLLLDNKICIMEIHEKMLKAINYVLEDSSEIISYGLKVKGVEISVLFKEATNGVKISFRSKDTADVRKIAENFFGGGHSKASGAFIPNVTLEEAKNIVIPKLKDELKL